MGAALSTKKFLATPLTQQWKFPFVVNPRFCRQRVTTFELSDNFWMHAIDINGYAVRDIDTNRVLFRVMPTIGGEVSDGWTKWLVDEYGIPVAHMTQRDHPGAAAYDVCIGNRRQPEPKVLTTFVINFVSNRSDPLLAEVDDPHSGGKSRVGCHGTWRQRAAVLYFERGRGGQKESIAKVYRPASNRMTMCGGNTYHVEIAIGVDMALVLLICAAMDGANAHRYKAQRHL
ncbi:unnamed protein product [Peronospora belbahrii]|uniref:Tubby C-terminal domain-containing protein n=1 Tax=Peronospora belbahrii TaxID=622444 RepID=A0AAU9KRG6_9STRA|nr:unnamed protein product [Peronospora belbahrii]CAH0515038.1 unnamed protein product [Peronospora belbahrii]